MWQTWGQFNSVIGIDYLKKNGIGIVCGKFHLTVKGFGLIRLLDFCPLLAETDRL